MDVSLTAESIAEFKKSPLFADKTWVWSPNFWELDDSHSSSILDLGNAAVSFYKGIDLLYRKSYSNQSILRNEELCVPWVAEYYDAGKPQWLVDHARSKIADRMPAVLRPDLLPVSDGLALTEWDSVPGGIGLTAQLEFLYGLAKDAGMVKQFGLALNDAVKTVQREKANMAIVVSEEAETYRPEMEWLAEELGKLSYSIIVCSPEELKVSNQELFCRGNRIHLVYRFWELFDFANVPVMKELTELVESEKLVVTPPMIHTHEEKLSLALFHHHRLQDFWQEILTKAEIKILKAMIPPSWIVDPAELPPGAYLDGPLSRGKRLTSWMDLAKASKKERSLILKASGFHETAWGARSVVLGDDVSADEWSNALQSALRSFPTPVSIIQEFRKPVRLEHPVFNSEGKTQLMKGRLRLSPYYFIYDGRANWSGTLATFCPVDKKIIHGMKDGALMPAK